ncbi:MAG: helix-turn-helix domain-containing protein [Povalibacter sp.]
MSRIVYQDFDEFADDIDGADGRFVPTARATGDWWIERAFIGELTLQQLQVGAAATYAGDGSQGRASVWIPLSNPASIRVDGHALDESTCLVIRSPQPFTMSSPVLSRWANIVFPDAMLTDGALGHLTHLMLEPELGAARVSTAKPLLEQLKSRIAALCSEHEPIRMNANGAIDAEKSQIIQLLRNALETGGLVTDKHIGRPQVSRTRVIARCLELIDASEGQPLFIHDLCTASQVSERTLRNIFQEYFGVGPMRLLKVRQLREIRSALLRADSLTGTVTNIAAQFGVWDFSLFARNYRALYGMSPSETLRGPRQARNGADHSVTATPTWIGFATRRFTPASARSMSVDASTTESV